MYSVVYERSVLMNVLTHIGATLSVNSPKFLGQNADLELLSDSKKPINTSHEITEMADFSR